MIRMNPYFLMILFIGCFVSTINAKDALCDATMTIPTGKCCSREYAKYCCSGIPVCPDGENVTEVQHYAPTSPCSTPWNLSACEGGFYTTNGTNTLQCPEGYFCENYTVCLKPCPIGAYCIQNQLKTGNCSSYQQCCEPSNSPPIFDMRSKQLICAGNYYPSRCLAGNYCPNTTSMFECPSGHFCREGSQRAVKCPPISPCGTGETSPNTLYVGLIVNGCLLFVFLLVLMYFNNRHAVNFYCGLYKRRVTGTRKLSQRYNLADGIRLAINRLPKDTSRDELELAPKQISYNISFNKLSLKLTSGTNKGKVLLQGVTGEINAGEVTAVLGPSGAGKTTFLNVLCGKAYYGVSGGTIRINGKKVKGIQDYKSLTGFVPQDDIMHRSLTVYEVLYYNALLRLPPQSDPKYYNKMVKSVLNLLGIRHVANTQIGDEEKRGISGGQRRRVNIGMELVADPTILFLDEPTTGLDSSSSLAVVKALNTVASTLNLTVLCVIHQPRFEILKMFDKVLFLGRGGRTVYSGSVENAESYFGGIGYPLPPYVNPADFYMDVISCCIKNKRNIYTDLFQEWEDYQMQVSDVVAETSSKVSPAHSEPGEVNTVAQHSEVNAADELSEVKTADELSEVNTVDELSEVNTADELREVNTADKLCEVNTVDELCEVNPVDELSQVNPADELSEVKTPAERIRPCSQLLFTARDAKIQIQQCEESLASSSSSTPPTFSPPTPSPSPTPSDASTSTTSQLNNIRPGFFIQLWIFIRREFVLQLHMAKTLLLDQVLTLIAGAVLGLLFREVYIYDVHETTVLGNIIAGLGAIVAATRRFGLNRVVFWRESAAGINRFSYFIAVNLAYIPILLISPAVYLSIYYSLAAFLAPFAQHYLVFLCAWFYLSGLGYCMSLILTPRNSQMAAIITVVIMALLSGGSPELCKLDDTFIATAFYNLSFSRWVAEAVFEIEAHENSDVLRDIISRVQIDNHYDLNSFSTCIIALLSMGFGFRVIALLLLLFTKRGQQK